MSIKSIKEFDYFAPKKLIEVLELLGKYGSEAKVIAGGTDMIPKMKAQLISPKYIISLKHVEEIKYLDFDRENGLHFGAGVPIREVENFAPVKELFPAIYEGAHCIASTQIRNAGTLVGNICNAVPSADSAPGMIVLGAVLHVTSLRGNRDVEVGDFFTGVCKTVLEPDEFVTGVSIPSPKKNSKNMYKAFTVRRALDLAMVGSAANINVEDGICMEVRIALGAVATTPKRAYNAEKILIAQRLTASEKDCTPITDMRATREYRKELVRVLTRDVIKACI